MSSAPIIDVHNHRGDISATGAVGGGDTVRTTIAEGDAAADEEIAARLAVLDARGVDQAVIIGPHGYLRPDGIVDTRRLNDGTAAYRDRRPDRFPAAVGIVEPLYGNRGLDEIDRCAHELGFVGISFHTRFQGVSNDSPWVRRYLERIGDLGLLAFVHAVGESAAEALWKVDVLAGDLPDLRFIVLDAFSTFEQSMFVPHVAERRPNLFFDTATSHGWGFLAPLVRRCGASRLLYGSDLHSPTGGAGLHDPLDDLLGAGLSDEDRAAILGGNAARLLQGVAVAVPEGGAVTSAAVAGQAAGQTPGTDELDVPDDLLDAQARMLELGFGDGLPLIPPTPQRVEWMLGGTTRDPDELIGIVLPRKGRATVRRVAVNAVMAGALPEYLPVILAAMEGVIDPVFNIGGVNATGHNCGPLVIVSGPAVRELDINAGMGLFGPGWRANATIGRAVRLSMVHIGGAKPGEVDRSVHGHPGKYTYCIGEDADYGPWSKLNSDHGNPHGSVVMVMAAEAPHSVVAWSGMSGSGILACIADAAATLGSNKILTSRGDILVVLGPYGSERLFAEGWTKRDVQMFLFEKVRRRVGELRRSEVGRRTLTQAAEEIRWADVVDDDALLPLVEDPDRFVVMATPGENWVSSVVPNWCLGSRPVVVPVRT